MQRVERWTLRSVGRGFKLEATLRNNLGQVVYTSVVKLPVIYVGGKLPVTYRPVWVIWPWY